MVFSSMFPRRADPHRRSLSRGKPYRRLLLNPSAYRSVEQPGQRASSGRSTVFRETDSNRTPEGQYEKQRVAWKMSSRVQLPGNRTERANRDPFANTFLQFIRSDMLQPHFSPCRGSSYVTSHPSQGDQRFEPIKFCFHSVHALPANCHERLIPVIHTSAI